MGGGIGSAANLDVLLVLGVMVACAAFLAWRELRRGGEAPPEASTGHEAPAPPVDGIARPVDREPESEVHEHDHAA